MDKVIIAIALIISLIGLVSEIDANGDAVRQSPTISGNLSDNSEAEERTPPPPPHKKPSCLIRHP